MQGKRIACEEGESTADQRIENWWGFLRKQRLKFWISLFEDLKKQRYGGFIQFHCMGLIQDELDNTAQVWDSHMIRAGHQRITTSPVVDPMSCAQCLKFTGPETSSAQ